MRPAAPPVIDESTQSAVETETEMLIAQRDRWEAERKTRSGYRGGDARENTRETKRGRD
jgi:hypothetical protein